MQDELRTLFVGHDHLVEKPADNVRVPDRGHGGVVLLQRLRFRVEGPGFRV